MNFSMYSKFARGVRDNGIESMAKYARSLGFSSVEFFEFIGENWQEVVPSVEVAKEFRHTLETYGLTVACYSVAVGLYDASAPDGIDHKAEQTLMRYAERAAALGSPYLHHTITLGSPTDLPYEKMLKTVLPAVVRVAKYAQTLGVRCIYEDQGPYFNGVEGFRDFFEAVKAEEPSVGVCGDVGNTYFVDESSVDFFRAYAEHICHVHIKDYVIRPTAERGTDVSRGGKHLKECVVGTGIVDVPTCLQILKNAGYTGAFALENGHEEDYAMGVATAFKLINDNF
ncbi:MAG: sugar phosphate isomerase/epimerase [Clostridia bacterium]|nr:sugar phosphate isomerase/epimerase [Clostridia bacterium]